MSKYPLASTNFETVKQNTVVGLAQLLSKAQMISEGEAEEHNVLEEDGGNLRALGISTNDCNAITYSEM